MAYLIVPPTSSASSALTVATCSERRVSNCSSSLSLFRQFGFDCYFKDCCCFFFELFEFCSSTSAATSALMSETHRKADGICYIMPVLVYAASTNGLSLALITRIIDVSSLCSAIALCPLATGLAALPGVVFAFVVSVWARTTIVGDCC